MQAPEASNPPAKGITPASPTLKRIQALALGSLLALIALGLAWELWLAPLRPGGSWWAIKVLPLALPLAGLLKNRMYTYRWLSLLVWLYFTEGVVRATTERGLSAVLAGLEVLLSVLLFVACVWHVRSRLRAAGKEAIAAELKASLAAFGLKMPALAMPVRVLVMGTPQTPSVDAVLWLQGREKVLAALQKA